MRVVTLFTAALFILTGSSIFAQADRIFYEQNNDKNITTSFDRLFQQESKPDYKIISSNSSYFEIEFYPASVTNQKLNVKSGSLDIYNFENSSSKDIKSAGSPD